MHPIRTCRPGRRDGFALPVALGALVVVALVITGVFYTSHQQLRSSTDQVTQEVAFRAAERGLSMALANWDAPRMGALVRGHPMRRAYDVPGQFTDTVFITKLDTALFLVTSIATTGRGTNQSRRELMRLVRTAAPKFNVLGALTVRGTSRIGGSSLINGYDTPPSGWVCPEVAAPLPGLANVNGRSDVDLSGCSGGRGLRCIDGNPQIQSLPAAGDTATYFNFGDLNWSDLVAAATVRLPAGATYTQLQPSYNPDGSCNAADLRNWGDLTRRPRPGACESYFPIVHFSGSLSSNTQLSNGSGQGIMLVDGDLTLTGNFLWHGPVIIRGAVQTTGAGGRVFGAVMAADVNLNVNTVLGDAVINYSNCAIQSAITAATTVLPVRQRAFAQQF